MISNQLFIEFKSELLKIKDKKKLEKAYYDKLSKCLKSGQFKAFELLADASIDFNIFIDITRISDRFRIISNLILNCIDKISKGYQTSALGDIINILRLSNKYNLVEKEINDSEKKFLIYFREKNTLFIENIYDLFEKASDSFILYVCKVIPNIVYNYLISHPIPFFLDPDELMDFIKNRFLNLYSVYGLNVRNLSSEENSYHVEKLTPLEEFFWDLHKNQEGDKAKIDDFIEVKKDYKDQVYYNDTEEEHEQIVEKIHLISPRNILQFKDKILDKNNYNFYNLSMVLLGGLGPQGIGFTYSTPKGEVIEICSDQSESEAIIIKFKQYLKRKFLIKLEKELKNYGIDNNLKNTIIKFLSDILNQKELIHYYKKEAIIEKVKDFLGNIEHFQQEIQSELQDLIRKISEAISIILRRIKLRDQYITRIKLVAEKKIKPEDIAKLTSLKGKSHYDILSERFFFQYLVSRVYELHNIEKTK
ncbi:MAG: hypothetical protein ACFFA4_02125 [Promethearchaeota archaeon]